MIRPAVDADLAEVAVLEASLFGADAWPATSLAEELTGPGRTVLVAEEEGAVAGYAIGMLAGDVADLLRLGVHPHRQRRGIAAALVEDLLARCRAGGAERVLLEVSSGNDAALAFYAAAGFARVDVRGRYYRDGSDAIIHHRPLLADCPGERP
ncbi:ribosomal protein S18-alanine N-acetyltransferase [Nocardioides donggukensis]|uniref:[Ribosomal protein bS18]-alanine N-acetyltransferase n=1 Tax=Nocardioides donggukensis TaxID=2774019 RepID=A0A927PZ67_9ACTN|nr:ribosomal protein S18-alanine N-acetyltransferase [Nocardioides donggukensis]MBD8868545.1 ribosomal protein S18-alanine N-acetyltransferase [Nocardioides donggukensis]